MPLERTGEGIPGTKSANLNSNRTMALLNLSQLNLSVKGVIAIPGCDMFLTARKRNKDRSGIFSGTSMYHSTVQHAC